MHIDYAEINFKTMLQHCEAANWSRCIESGCGNGLPNTILQSIIHWNQIMTYNEIKKC